MERIMDTAKMEFTGEEIIRCRDCKHSGDYGWSCRKWQDGEYDEDVKPDGFCAWAERDE